MLSAVIAFALPSGSTDLQASTSTLLVKKGSFRDVLTGSSSSTVPAAVNIAAKVTIKFSESLAVALPAESAYGLHKGSGFDDKADHCRKRQYKITKAEVSSLASSLRRKQTINCITNAAIDVKINKVRLV